ncbi:deoxyuridine 5'-triphosphate nucleotidohydrolase [Alphaproteobacteria bacterium]|nr:deoxyuridine 5'-triphosphate nucleotidohydrolase [Alphaproteobacteria bacterium]
MGRIVNVKIKKLRSDAILPEYQTPLSAGFDFHACIDKDIILKPGERYAVPTGLSMSLPAGYVTEIYARSGLAAKYGVAMANGVGVIDADYRGEYLILLGNYGNEKFIIEPNMRIAQGIIKKHETAEWEEIDELDETTRGKGGFGSTGA